MITLNLAFHSVLLDSQSNNINGLQQLLTAADNLFINVTSGRKKCIWQNFHIHNRPKNTTNIQ